VKSNVNLPMQRDLARLRASALSVLGLAACSSTPDADGLVVAPMAETASSATAIELDASADAPTHHRVAIEPHAPGAQMACTRDVSCVAELPAPPPNPYNAPFDKCDPAPLGEVGHLSPIETTSKRKDDPTMCCYVSFSNCQRRYGGRRGGRVMIGRPLRDEDGQWITANAIESSAWTREPAERTAHDARDENEALATFFANGAALEHASVAEFARLSLALLALGAPPDLVEDAHRAAIDEIAHAKTCFSLASRFSGRDVGPAALDVSRASREHTIASVARDALVDGCLGEAAASIELRAMARDARAADVADALSSMADDEERHAALAWRIVRFAMACDADATRAELTRFARDLDTRDLTPAESVLARDVIRPCLDALLT